MIELTDKDIGKIICVFRTIDNKEIKHEGYFVENLKDSIKLKLLDNGYNISILKNEINKIEITFKKADFGKIPTKDLKQNKNLPNIVYIGTGGTIGTHVDYVTGGVNMCRTPEEIISTTPELENIINIKNIESPFIKASEDIYYKDWQEISKIIFKYLSDETIDGIIITHGTDTLSFTGTAISFMIENINKPVLLVGAQKSPDRASFDGSLNLICAAQFIKEKVPGVFTVMHGSINDDFCSIIKAVKSRKMHTSRRDAFKPINDNFLCKIFSDGRIEYTSTKKDLFNLKKPILNIDFEEKVALIKIYPNSDPAIIDWYIEKGYKGLILEGTGLGHVPTAEDLKEKLEERYRWLPFLKKAVSKGLIVIMTSQCLFGRVNSKVYSNLRYISDIGVEYLDNHDMLPEVALIKLSVALKKFKKKEEIIKYMSENISGEITTKEIVSFYDSILI
jgi:glutamyl-tRNA(Gln) amidotransferase subunit D